MTGFSSVTVTFSDTDTPSEDGSGDSLEYDGGSQNNNTKAPSLSEQADSEFENRILFADGAIYYGTSEIGPMGDSRQCGRVYLILSGA